MSRERAEAVAHDFLEEHLAQLGIGRALKSVEALVKADSKGGERVSWDSLLLVLLDVYIELQPWRSWSLSQPAGSSDIVG